jgi:hypothetical protein
MNSNQYIKANEPLKEILEDIYSRIIQILDDLNQKADFSSEKEYEEAKTIVANNIYLIYERIYLKIVRGIDYSNIQIFAKRNNEFIKYIFKKNFPEASIEAFNTWIQTSMNI